MTTTFLIAKKTTGRKTRFSTLHPTRLSSVQEIQSHVPQAKQDTLWIIDDLIVALLQSIDKPTKKKLGRAVLLNTPSIESFSALSQAFQQVIYGQRLPEDEFAEAINAPNSYELFISGTVNKEAERINLWTGDFRSLSVPFSAFTASENSPKPDFDNFSLKDYGHYIGLGRYEAASDAILYEYDPSYRARLRKLLEGSEKSIGASIRRLRKQRGLRREDFPVAAKTITRIEKGQTHPTAPTLQKIADTLGVAVEDLSSY